MKKRILLISDVKGWGGWVRAQYIKKHLSNEFDFTLVDSSEFKQMEQVDNKDCFTMKDVQMFRSKSPDKELLNFNDFKSFFVGRKKPMKFDLYYLLFHTMLIKKSVKRILHSQKRVATIVTGYPTIKPCFRKTNFVELARKCKSVFANNILSLTDLNKVLRNEKVGTYYCPRGVDEHVFYPTNDFNPEKRFTVVYVGKPVPEKGLMEFIKPACEAVDVKLIINDRNYTNALGPNDMRSLYNQADVYLVASTIDGTPNPALEAASCGKPIISNRIGNMPEFIRHGTNGFLMDERNVNEYIQFLKQLKSDRRKCYEMGLKARKTIEKEWTWKKVLENERIAFREITNGLQGSKQKEDSRIS